MPLHSAARLLPLLSGPSALPALAAPVTTIQYCKGMHNGHWDERNGVGLQVAFGYKEEHITSLPYEEERGLLTEASCGCSISLLPLLSGVVQGEAP